LPLILRLMSRMMRPSLVRMGTVRRVCRNVKRWQNVDMALRWTAAGMMEAAKGFSSPLRKSRFSA
jgi:hypothetical protein